MHIDKITVKNFRGFEERTFEFNPSFNLIVGVNGAGKTSLLDALRVALGGWHYALKIGDKEHRRNINRNEIRLKPFEKGERLNLEPQYPTVITASGHVMGRQMTWIRKQERSYYDNTGDLFFKDFLKEITGAVQAGSDIILPLIVCYDVGRHWYIPKEQEFDDSQRLSGYKESFNTKLLASRVNEWLYKAEYRAFSKNKPREEAGKEFKRAILSCLDGGKRLYFDGDRKQIVVQFEDGHAVPYENLSDGQRSTLTYVGDIARRIMVLNPGLGEEALNETTGVVLIDELDQHLHPRWQRSIIESLRSTFPKIQFIASTHSPFLIQSLRSGEELIMLEGQPLANLGNIGIEEIARGIMEVPRPDTSERYETMKTAAHTYLELLEEAACSPADKLEDYKQKLAEGIGPYADNPAFQAFLEMKRAVKLGE